MDEAVAAAGAGHDQAAGPDEAAIAAMEENAAQLEAAHAEGHAAFGHSDYSSEGEEEPSLGSDDDF